MTESDGNFRSEGQVSLNLVRYSEWRSQSPGWTFTAVSTRIDGGVSGGLMNLSSKGFGEHR